MSGSLMVPLRKILHNPEVYAEPLCFNPERFMPDAEGSDLTAVLSNFEAVYGVGRRICPGRFVAVAQLFVTIASILSVFDIRPGLDEDGKPIHVEPDFTFGVARFVPVVLQSWLSHASTCQSSASFQVLYRTSRGLCSTITQHG